MKSKQEKALAILEALELADESLVQQALDVDNAEKFRSLGPVRLVRNDKPTFARLGVLAACLALVATLAAFPWLLSKLPVYSRPTEPTVTTAPTEPTLPPTDPIPEPEIPGFVWQFDASTGTLTVGGCEAIPDYSDQDYLIMRPWSQHWLDIQHIRVADGVKRIGNFAFRDLPNLQDVSLPDGLREIGDHAFHAAQNLSIISLPQSLESIGDYAFYECRKLPAFDLPEGLKHIGIGAFTRCEVPTSLVIPASVETIGQSAFFNCVGLVDVTILGSPDELTLVFAGCSALRIVRFCGDAPLSLWELTYEKGVICYYPAQNPTWTNEVLGTANLDCTAWLASDDPASEQVLDNAVSGQCGRTAYWELADGVLTISGTGDVTYLGWDLLREQIQTVIIEDGITNIADSSFYQCGNLTDVTIPDSVTYIGFRAFYECVKLKAVTLPQNLTSLGDYAFSGCTGLKKLYFYGDAPGVSNFTFEGVTATAYYPPGNVSWISGGMRFHSGNITEKPDPNQENQGCITHDFGDWVILKEPTRLEGGKKERICNACGYKETEGLPPIVWEGEAPEHPELGEPIAGGFDHNVQWNLYEDGTLTIFGTDIMDDAMDHIWIENHRAQIKRLIIEEGLASIAGTAFWGLPNLVEVQLPNTLMRIGVYAFAGCIQLKSIMIPASVVEIENFAFGRCDALRQVYFLGDAPNMPNNIFNMDTLYVYYPANNETWNGRMWDYGGKITWVTRDFGAGYPLQLTEEPKRRA